ncbi:MAG: Stp1/IreP family PP2C-type Ser/Thr phosphatase [Pseudomonadales bacterium]|jgi:protein phosphatase|nr:Stp1/IreP family PP2C-type Ser/Thr phosphatase [Pseudomonadales bacterium]
MLGGSIATAGLTDRGHVREHNEDAIGNDPEAGLLVLADGMGGLEAGEVASALAVEVVLDDTRRRLAALESEEIDAETGLSPEALALRDAVHRANAVIREVAEREPQCAGMGTTLVAVLFHDNRVTVAHVGDSRLYRLSGERFERVTVDHSLVQELVERGFYTPEEARTASNRNIVTRALGIDDAVRVDVQEIVAEPGELFLLCSDGLNDMLEDARIGELLAGARGDLELAAARLVDAAKAEGGHDNVSVLLGRVDRAFPARRGWRERLGRWLG